MKKIANQKDEDVIFHAYCHFNFGLHNIKLPHKGHDPEHQRAKPEEFEIYEKELVEQIETLWGYSIKPLFSNTTPNPKNATHSQ